MSNDEKNLDNVEINIEENNGVVTIRVVTSQEVIYIAFLRDESSKLQQSIKEEKTSHLWMKIVEKLAISSLIDLVKEVISKCLNF